MIITVRNMLSKKTSRAIPNQFIITKREHGPDGNFTKQEYFQSYGTIIATKTIWRSGMKIQLDKNYWDYSSTTSRYRNQFLGETTKETRKKINSGKYEFVNLNPLFLRGTNNDKI